MNFTGSWQVAFACWILIELPKPKMRARLRRMLHQGRSDYPLMIFLVRLWS
jgi:hypothetical protein